MLTTDPDGGRILRGSRSRSAASTARRPDTRVQLLLPQRRRSTTRPTRSTTPSTTSWSATTTRADSRTAPTDPNTNDITLVNSYVTGENIGGAADQSDMTPGTPRLWPSDHGGVVSTLSSRLPCHPRAHRLPAPAAPAARRPSHAQEAIRNLRDLRGDLHRRDPALGDLEGGLGGVGRGAGRRRRRGRQGDVRDQLRALPHARGRRHRRGRRPQSRRAARHQRRHRERTPPGSRPRSSRGSAAACPPASSRGRTPRKSPLSSPRTSTTSRTRPSPPNRSPRTHLLSLTQISF